MCLQVTKTAEQHSRYENRASEDDIIKGVWRARSDERIGGAPDEWRTRAAKSSINIGAQF